MRCNTIALYLRSGERRYIRCFERDFHRRLDLSLMPPGELLFATLKAREIAAAGRASVGSGAHTQHHHCQARGVIILFAPGSEFLPVTSGTSRVLPGPFGPCAGQPTVAAAAAAQRIDADQPLDGLKESSTVGYSYFPRSATWTSQLHFSYLFNYRGSNRGAQCGGCYSSWSRPSVCFYVRRRVSRKRALQRIANGAAALEPQPFDRIDGQ